MKRTPALVSLSALIGALGLLGCTDRNDDAVPDQVQNAPGAAANTTAEARQEGAEAKQEVKEETNEANREIRDGAQKAAELGDNASTTGRIKSALLADAQVPATGINVDTKNDVVTLKGEVETAAQKQRAEEIAKKTKGVKSVVNDLKVKGRE